VSGPVQTTLEEARRCPRCDEPGQKGEERALDRTSGATRGARLFMFYCRNGRCRWYNTSWGVQVNPDGTVPPPTTSRDKFFRPLPDDGGRTAESLEEMQKLTEQAHAEIHPRYRR
jgi:hypothetical protein